MSAQGLIKDIGRTAALALRNHYNRSSTAGKDPIGVVGGGQISSQAKMVEDKYVGLALAILSTMAIGTSFVITKKGLLEASERHGFEGEGFAYLKSPTWWGGIVTMVLGEVANFAAYAFAPAILVTPLGALSVLIGAVLGSYFLKEDLGTLGKLGCALCLIGSVIIVLHAPPDKEIQTVDEILQYAIHPGTGFSRSVFMEANSPCYHRISSLLHRSCHLLQHYDLQGRSKARKEKSSHIYLHLFHGWICVCHVSKGFRYCLKVDLEWEQPTYPSIDLRFCHRHCVLHIDPDELLQ